MMQGSFDVLVDGVKSQPRREVPSVAVNSMSLRGMFGDAGLEDGIAPNGWRCLLGFGLVIRYCQHFRS